MACVCAPPSDQDTKFCPPWGDGAPIVRWIPTTPTTELGAVKGAPSRVSCRPVGFVAKVIVTVRGRTSRITSVTRPALSTTDRWIRYQTLGEVSPIVGITKEPLVMPAVGGMKGW